MGATVGAIFGAQLNGWASAKYGYRWVCIIGLGFLNCFIFLTFFAPSKAVLLVGQITCGRYQNLSRIQSGKLTISRSDMGYFRYNMSRVCI